MGGWVVWGGSVCLVSGEALLCKSPAVGCIGHGRRVEGDEEGACARRGAGAARCAVYRSGCPRGVDEQASVYTLTHTAKPPCCSSL